MMGEGTFRHCESFDEDVVGVTNINKVESLGKLMRNCEPLTD